MFVGEFFGEWVLDVFSCVEYCSVGGFFIYEDKGEDRFGYRGELVTLMRLAESLN